MTTVKPLAAVDENLGHIDFIIVGAGPAGLTVAAELAETGAQVLVLESAGKTETPETAALLRTKHEGDLTAEEIVEMRRDFHGETPVHWTAEVQEYGVRCRIIGGSSIAWAGKSATFDQMDFNERDWVPNSGWPITRESLVPYFDRAAEILNLGPNVYDDEFWEIAKRKPAEPTFDPNYLRSYFWQFARSRVDPMDIYRAGEEFLLVDRPNVTVVTDATVLKVLTDETGSTATGVLATSIDGTRRELFADTVVLAASAIENPRLLLLSRDAKPAGLGNDYDQVGRYLMDHPGGQVGRFPIETLGPIKKRFGFYSLSHKGHALMYMPGLALTDDYQEANKELNSSVFFLMDRAEDNPFDALRRLLHRDTSNRWADLKSIVSNIGLVLAAVGQKALQSGKVPHGIKTFVSNMALRISPNFVVEEFETRGVPHKITGVKMYALTEQPPNPENRVVLSDEVDAFGQPVPKVIWRVGEQPRATLAHLANIVADELEKSGLPRPELVDWARDNRPEDAVIIDMAHTLGTTRMSTDAQSGVVDTDCKVHGVEGLYIAGGSVFPTSGHANPTLMIASVCVRLADHLRDRYNCRNTQVAAE